MFSGLIVKAVLPSFIDGKRPTRHLIDEQSYDCSESAEARSDERFDIYAAAPSREMISLISATLAARALA